MCSRNVVISYCDSSPSNINFGWSWKLSQLWKKHEQFYFTFLLPPFSYSSFPHSHSLRCVQFLLLFFVHAIMKKKFHIKFVWKEIDNVERRAIFLLNQLATYFQNDFIVEKWKLMAHKFLLCLIITVRIQ
jgi:hypothetical protein